MKAAGFLLLLAGWLLVVAALILLRAGASRAIFMVAGAGVEVLGLALAIRAHLSRPRPESA